MKDYESAIEVCREALAVDWDGDWDVRIARYEKRQANASKRKKQKAKVSGNVITVDPEPSKPSRPKFCTECGASLEGAINFCTQCGTAI